MSQSFSNTMSALRRARGLSQRTAAADLNISQALLSHYENGAREPGLDFVCRACRYYNVSADYLLGLTDVPTGSTAALEALTELTAALDAAADRARATLKDLGAKRPVRTQAPNQTIYAHPRTEDNTI